MSAAPTGVIERFINRVAAPVSPESLLIFLSPPIVLIIQAKARLRALGLAVTFFGETQAQRSARLLQAEDDKGHHQDDFTLADGHNVVSQTSASKYSSTSCLRVYVWVYEIVIPDCLRTAV